ncbi:MAG: ribonucleotide reductase [candidate division SR1 bacterium]|nr:MAG: ribonucleotide reductase [candidate division SR1 bacterium]
MPIKQIRKRNGILVDFDLNKIINAIKKSMIAEKHPNLEDAVCVAEKVQDSIYKKRDENSDFIPHVEEIQDLVEEKLMESGFHPIAKAYILYRQERIQERKRDIFKKRITLKPYEYPELLEYVDAIRHSYWIHTEFNFTSDVQDFKVNVSESERNALKNTMLAIAQIEVSVKTFRGDIYKKLPKPEIGSVGYTFAESEVRHHDAYSHLLEILGLNHDFNQIKTIPCIINRVNYLEKSINIATGEENRDYAMSVLLFSLFIEHVSLFSQFLIIMAFNKYRNLFKGMSNAVEATSKEEQIHGLFGIEIINIIKQEKPEWFDEVYFHTIRTACKEAYEAEAEIIDWIFEAGELDFLPKAVIKAFVQNRMNNSLKSIGLEPLFEVDEKLVQQTDWFDDEVIATKHVDFFNKRSINYNKRSQSITSDDLF